VNARPRLLFVYNADSGLFNTLADIGHKLLSPATYRCRLCTLTHGYFRERHEWRELAASLEAECRFLHRDEFRERYPDDATALPAVFRLEGTRPVPCVDAAALRGCADLPGLGALIQARCLNVPGKESG
jgi:hypothetical protein